jgi:hypothetical protein
VLQISGNFLGRSCCGLLEISGFPSSSLPKPLPQQHLS